MNLSFLPVNIKIALDNLNYNYLTEIRLRVGQPVIVGYRGEYSYLGSFGITQRKSSAIVCEPLGVTLGAAMERSVYAYSEQLKNAFITVGGGIRIGICGEYVTENGKIKTVCKPTSLNIRIPHDAAGCAREIYLFLCEKGFQSTVIFSPPGYGKTTILRDFARQTGEKTGINVLVFDERYELSAIENEAGGYDMGMNCDIVRGANKYCGFANAIRAMKPDLIICDELYGDDDFSAVKYASDCGIRVVASTHFAERRKLADLPFDCYIQLTGIGKQAIIYDKNFNIIGNCDTVGAVRGNTFG